MYRYDPPRKNRVAVYVASALSASAIVMIFFTSFFPNFPLRSVLQTVAMCLLIAAVLVVSRYLTHNYAYEVVQGENGKLDFTVTELRRKSRITVCRIGLDDVRRAEMVTAENREVLKRDARKKKKYHYCVDMCPDSLCYLFVEELGEEVVICLSPDQTLFSILSEHAKKEKEL